MAVCRSATCTWIDAEYASTPQLVRIVPVPIRVGMIRSSPRTGRCRCRSAPGARPGPVNRSSCPCRRRVQLEDQMIHFWWPSRGPRLPQAADHRSALVPVEDLFDHVRLGRFDERHHRHLAAALGTTQGVHFIDTLDQHRPRLATARSGGLLTRWLVGYGGLRLLPHPTRLVRVPTVAGAIRCHD